MSDMTLCYSGMPLDRAAHRRRDHRWVAEQTAQRDGRYLPVHCGDNLFRANTLGDYLALDRTAIAPWLDPTNPHTAPILLGLQGRTPYFAVDVSAMAQQPLTNKLNGQFMALRQVAGVLSAGDCALLGYARGMVHWHARHKFCPHCSAVTRPAHGGAHRICTAPDCAQAHFPRTDPAVIMLVEHPNGGACLLGRNKRFTEPVFSTLAGYVDVGETLEEAVAREVWEETGVVVDNIRYIASQPWPFPNAIMLGFHATAGTTKITVDPDELLEADWFSARQLADFGEFGEFGEHSGRPVLPRRDSIARLLIERWVAKSLIK